MKDGLRLYFYLAFCLVIAICGYFTTSIPLKVVLFGVVMYSTYFLKFVEPIYLYIGVSILMSMGSSMFFLLLTLPLYLNKNSYSVMGSITKSPVVFVIVVLSFLSFCTGIQASFTTMLVFFMGIWLYIMTSNISINDDEFYIYVVFSFLVVALTLYIQLLRGEIVILYNRLAFDDNIRKLADVIAIPAFVSFSYLIMGKGSISYKILYCVVGVLSAAILMMTLSKGALISAIVGLLVVLIKSTIRRGGGKSVLYFLILGIFSYWAFCFVSNMDDTFGVSRLSEEDDGFSGRTYIWDLYYVKLMESPVHAILGFGPGELQRLNYSEFYAHSAFLDIFFSYGISMSVIMCLVLIKIFRYVYRSKDTFAMAFLVFSCLLFTTHGLCTNHQLYILVAISVALAKHSNNDTISDNCE